MVDGLGYYGRRSLRELFSVIFAHLTMIVLLILIVVAITAIACLYMPKVYRSEVSFWAKLNKPISPLAEQADPSKRLEVFLKTQHQIIYSDIVIRRTLARLKDPAVRSSASFPSWDSWRSKVEKIGQSIPTEEVVRFRRNIELKTPGGEDIGSSEVFTISVEAEGTPEDAKAAADILAQEYIIRRKELQTQLSKSSQELLNAQLEELREKVLGAAERKFNDFIKNKVNGNLLDLTQLMYAHSEVNNQRLQTIFQEKLISIDAEISEYNALKKELEAQIPAKALKDGPGALTDDELDGIWPVVPEKVLTSNSIIDKLKKKLADLIIERNTLSQQYTEDFKLLRQKNGEIRQLKKDLLNELIAELQAIDQHISVLEAYKDKIQQEVAHRKAIIDNLSSLYVEYESLLKELELARKLYADKRKELLDAETARQMAQREALITKVDEATLPDPSRPVRPVFWLYTTIAALIGLIVGTGYAFIIDSYDHRLRSIDQAERYLGKPVLTTVPQISGGIIK